MGLKTTSLKIKVQPDRPENQVWAETTGHRLKEAQPKIKPCTTIRISNMKWSYIGTVRLLFVKMVKIEGTNVNF